MRAITPPFVDAAPTEVIARVAYQIVRRDYRINPARYEDPATGLRQLQEEMIANRVHILLVQLSAMAFWLRQGKGKLVDWKIQTVHTSRRTAYIARDEITRKSGRGPRVTNRGAKGRGWKTDEELDQQRIAQLGEAW